MFGRKVMVRAWTRDEEGTPIDLTHLAAADPRNPLPGNTVFVSQESIKELGLDEAIIQAKREMR